MAIIACMLISLWTGRKPTLRTYEMICHYFTGLADEEELLEVAPELLDQCPDYIRADGCLGEGEGSRMHLNTHGQAVDKQRAALELLEQDLFSDKPFDFPGLVFTPSVDESRRVNAMDEPAIVIAGSGMCTAGRIRHHLKHGIWDPRNTVLFVGYQAPGTLGRILLDGAEEIKMMGDTYAVKAEITKVGSFSAHADQLELTNWLTSFREKPKTVFLIHGESDTLESFSASLNEQGFTTRIAEKGIPLFNS